MTAGTGRWPFNMNLAFAIRDDDISYFTEPWMLQRIYKEAWRLGFKVSLAVIPNVLQARQSSNIQCFPISENKELVDFLMEKIEDGCVDIAQHGYTHSDIGGKPEFAVRDLELADYMLRKGNRLLRETFKRDVNVFVAPHDKISPEAWKSIVQNNMCLCRRFTLGRFLVTAPLLKIDFYKLVKTILHRPNPSRLLPDSIIDLADMFVIQWHHFFSSEMAPDVQLENGKQQFLECQSEGGVFVTMHHHWDYFYNRESRMTRRDLLASFNDFLGFVSSAKHVWRTTLSEICSWARDQELN